ncbi:MAG: hypothetical protein KJ922_05915, partial [Nanoarchaeota archaeon]|nr:hypothetical protein [Nanoarchaeota archaeon]
MNKKFSIYLILMLVASVPAFGFEVSTEPITDKITLEEVAEYKLTITNTAVNEQKFNIRTIDFPLWDVYTKPVVNPITVDVLPSESESVTLFVDPLHITSIGGYDV